MQPYIDLPDVESCPDFMKMKQMVNTKIHSLSTDYVLAKENVCEKLLSVFGYPHNIEMFTYQNSNKTDFVEVSNNTLLASVEIKNDEVSFWVETNYYGDWYK